FDQQVTACEQTRHGELYRLLLSYNHVADLLYEHVNVVRHARMICGDNAFRKHHVGELSFGFVTFADTLVQALNLASDVFCRSLRSPCCVRWRSVRARARHCCARTILDRGRGGMRVSITFCG